MGAARFARAAKQPTATPPSGPQLRFVARHWEQVVARSRVEQRIANIPVHANEGVETGTHLGTGRASHGLKVMRANFHWFVLRFTCSLSDLRWFKLFRKSWQPDSTPLLQSSLCFFVAKPKVPTPQQVTRHCRASCVAGMNGVHSNRTLKGLE